MAKKKTEAEKKAALEKKRQAHEQAFLAFSMAGAIELFSKQQDRKHQISNARTDNRMNEMVLGIEEANLSENYMDRIRVFEKEAAAQAGGIEVAVAAQGIDIDSGSAQAVKRDHRMNLSEDFDALRSKVWGQQMGIDIRRSNLRLSDQALDDFEKDAFFADIVSTGLDLYENYQEYKATKA